jgi:hypothetical protein
MKTPNAQDVLADLQKRGVLFGLEEDGRLRFSAPPDVLTDADRAAIKEHKRALIWLLFPPPLVDPGVLHLPLADETPRPRHLSQAETEKAAGIVAYLRERHVLLTVSPGELSVIVGRPVQQRLIERIEARAALLHAYLACPSCGRHHSLCPPHGWCWPCVAALRDGHTAAAAAIVAAADTASAPEEPVKTPAEATPGPRPDQEPAQMPEPARRGA